MLLFADGFKNYGVADILKKWSTSAGTLTLGYQYCPHYGYTWQEKYSGLFTSDSTAYVGINLPSNPSTVIVGAWVYNTYLPGETFGSLGFELFNFCEGGTLADSGANTQCTISIGDGNVIDVYHQNRDLGSLVDSSVLLLPAGWNFIEAKVVFSQTVGSVIVLVNGVEYLNLVGIDTSHKTNGWCSHFAIGNNIDGSQYTEIRISDFYLLDDSGTTNNDFLGPITVETIYPKLESTNTDFTPSTGTDKVSLISDSVSTTYIYSDTTGFKDSYICKEPWLPQNAVLTYAIYAVQLNIFAKKTAAFNCDITPFCTISSTDYMGDTVSMGLSTLDYIQIWENNPDTATNWTQDELKNTDFGVESTLVSASTQLRVEEITYEIIRKFFYIGYGSYNAYYYTEIY